jgi:hypothetical protein
MIKEDMRLRCKPLVLAVIDNGRPIDIPYYDAMFHVIDGLNSYERYLLRPLFDRELLIRETEYCLNQCSVERRIPPSTYDDCVLHELVPLLIIELKKGE